MLNLPSDMGLGPEGLPRCPLPFPWRPEVGQGRISTRVRELWGPPQELGGRGNTGTGSGCPGGHREGLSTVTAGDR